MFNVDSFLTFLKEYEILFAIIVPFLNGESALHILGVAWGAGGTSFLVAYIVPVISLLVFYSFAYFIVYSLKKNNVKCFGLGRYKLIQKTRDSFSKLEKKFGHNAFLALLFVQFTPLTKALIFFVPIAYDISYKRFLLFILFTVNIHAIIFVFSGWLIGRGLLLQGSSDLLIKIISYLILVFILSFFFGKYLTKFIKGKLKFLN